MTHLNPFRSSYPFYKTYDCQQLLQICTSVPAVLSASDFQWKVLPALCMICVHVFVLNCSGVSARVSNTNRHTRISNDFVPVTELSSHVGIIYCCEECVWKSLRCTRKSGTGQIKVESLQNCVHRQNGVRIAFTTLLGPLVEFSLPSLNVDIIWYQWH
jgi:hypothetical protein